MKTSHFWFQLQWFKVLLFPVVNTSAPQVVNSYLSCKVSPHQPACELNCWNMKVDSLLSALSMMSVTFSKGQNEQQEAAMPYIPSFASEWASKTLKKMFPEVFQKITFARDRCFSPPWGLVTSEGNCGHQPWLSLKCWPRKFITQELLLWLPRPCFSSLLNCHDTSVSHYDNLFIYI